MGGKTQGFAVGPSFLNSFCVKFNGGRGFGGSLSRFQGVIFGDIRL